MPLKSIAAFAAFVALSSSAEAATIFEQISPSPTVYSFSSDYVDATFNPAFADVTAPIFATIGIGGLSDGCNPFNPANVQGGTIFLITRGTCSFQVKVLNAQQAGAGGVLVVNTEASLMPVVLPGFDPNIAIPTFGITYSLGSSLMSQLDAGNVMVRLAIGDNVAAAVPEAETWAMMLAGFGGIGVMLRRRRDRKAIAA